MPQPKDESCSICIYYTFDGKDRGPDPDTSHWCCRYPKWSLMDDSEGWCGEYFNKLAYNAL